MKKIRTGFARARRALDQPGRRWILGYAYSAVATLGDRRRCMIRWEGSTWSYRYDGQILLSDQLLLPSKTFDPDLEIFLWDYAPRAGDVILDIGAGSGTEAVRLARAVGPSGRIVAVEAHPRTASILERASLVNGLDNITVRSMAIADVAGVVRITDLEEAGTNTVLDGCGIEVPATTVDALIAACELERVDFLKMNIEGAERLAVLGMSEAARLVDRMAISCHDFLGTEWGSTRCEVLAWLEEHDFVVRSRPDDPRPWCRDYLYAERTTRP